MNTKSTTARIGIAAAIAGIALAATACGTEQASEPDKVGQAPAKVSGQTLRSPDAIERAARARAEHADALRWARGHASTEHSERAERADALRWARGRTFGR